MTEKSSPSQKAFLVLANHEGQYSLWPVGVETPDGWQVVYSSANRQECIEYVDSVWSDLRPLSLIEATGETCEAD